MGRLFFEHVARREPPLPNNVDPDPCMAKALLVSACPPWSLALQRKEHPNDPRVSALVFRTTPLCWKIKSSGAGTSALPARDASNDVQNLANAFKFRFRSTAVPTLPRPVGHPRAAMPRFRRPFWAERHVSINIGSRRVDTARPLRRKNASQ